MKSWKIRLSACLAGLCLLASGCRLPRTPDDSAPPESGGTPPSYSGERPSPEEEFRGVWVSYIELNALLKGKTQAQAEAALDGMMENIASYGLNTVFFHVRAMSDAYYPSKLFPPAAAVEALIEGGFDPLAYAVEAAHARGLELHAWINPYRIGVKRENAGCEDIFSVDSGGTPCYYYNPASEEAQSLILQGLAEVVDNYPVDGVQFDDYFYPSNAAAVPPDAPAPFEEEAYAAYTAEGGALGVADWRRAQVDVLVAGAYQKAHSREGCVFGVSPDYHVEKNYSSLYADVAAWIAVPGYVDYICPQIYFGFENSAAPFDEAVKQWAGYPRHASVRLYVGLGLYKTGMSPDVYAGQGKDEWAGHDDVMKRSVEFLRGQPEVTGMAFYNYSSFQAGARSPSAGQTYSKEVGQREVENLLSLLRQ